MGDGGGDEGVHGFVVDGYASAAAEGEAVGGVEREEGYYVFDMEMVCLLEAGVFGRPGVIL